MEAQSAVSAPLREWMTRRGLEEFIGAAGRVCLLEVSDLGFVDPETVEEMGLTGTEATRFLRCASGEAAGQSFELIEVSGFLRDIHVGFRPSLTAAGFRFVEDLQWKERPQGLRVRASRQ